jgi:hypothetical protein
VHVSYVLLVMLQPFIYVYKQLVNTGFAPAELNKALAEVETAASQGAANMIITQWIMQYLFILPFCQILRSLDAEHCIANNIPNKPMYMKHASAYNFNFLM